MGWDGMGCSPVCARDQRVTARLQLFVLCVVQPCVSNLECILAVGYIILYSIGLMRTFGITNVTSCFTKLLIPLFPNVWWKKYWYCFSSEVEVYLISFFSIYDSRFILWHCEWWVMSFTSLYVCVFECIGVGVIDCESVSLWGSEWVSEWVCDWVSGCMRVNG